MKFVRRSQHRLVVTLVLFGLLSSLTASAFTQFSGVRSKVELVGPKRTARPTDCAVEIFNDKKPEKQYETVARLDVYVRRNKLTQGRQAVYEEAVPELKKQACKTGADAVIVLRQTVSQSGEFKLLYVKAEAIHFPDSDSKNGTNLW